jgi:hypothetical protein
MTVRRRGKSLFDLLTKQLADLLTAKVEYASDFAASHQSMDDLPHKSEWQHVSNNIHHPSSITVRFKPVRVMPNPVRPRQLYVDEFSGRIPVADLGQPTNGQAM